jgi:hypothetical protein
MTQTVILNNLNKKFLNYVYLQCQNINLVLNKYELIINFVIFDVNKICLRTMENLKNYGNDDF